MPLAYTRELADYWANDMRSPSLLVDAHQMA